MSTALIPYHPREGRQYLRSETAVVVHNPDSQRLEPRALPASCPTCHRPWQDVPRAASPERNSPFDYHRPPFVDPDYFQMLRPLLEGGEAEPDHVFQSPPGSPVRRIAEPVRRGDGISRTTYAVEIEDEEGPRGGGKGGRKGSKIRKESFSQGYFDSFFVEEAVLGKGGKGVVLLVRHELNDNSVGRFACKRVPVGDDHEWLEKVLVEVRMLAFLDHPNLVSYHHVWLETKQLTRFGPEVVCAFILQQYCNGGDLHTYVLGETPKEDSKEMLKERMRRRSKAGEKKNMMPRGEEEEMRQGRQLEPAEIYSLFKDVVAGVASLHAENYVHRDLKPSNCLLHRDRHGKLSCLISDFGEVQPSNATRASTGSTGTLSYSAPEVLLPTAPGTYPPFTFQSDIFSMGMILYFMCFSRLPYRAANTFDEALEDVDELRAEITAWKGFEEERRMRPDLPRELYRLLGQLLAVDPEKRPSAGDVLMALRREEGFEEGGVGVGVGVGVRGQAGGAGIVRGRVQNLDSPGQPGTPVPDPRKSSRHLSTTDRPSSTWPTPSPSTAISTLPPSSSSQENITTLHHRSSTAMTLSHSRDGISQTLHPTNTTTTTTTTTTSNTPTDTLSQISAQDAAAMHPPPHLLMPPPPPQSLLSRLNIFNNNGHPPVFFSQSNNHAAFGGSLLPSVTYLLRLSIFIFKLATLVQPCRPYLPNLTVAIPLTVLAAMDLKGEGMGRGGQGGGRRGRYIEGSGSSSSSRRDIRGGMGLSVVLLVLHSLVLLVVKRWRGICVVAQEEFW